MTLRSRLFAGVALPFLSVAMTVQPVFAANDQQTFEIAQSSDEQQPAVLPEEQPQAQPEEQPAEPQEKTRKQQPAEEAAPAQEQAAPQPEPEAQAPAEQPAAAPQPEPAPAPAEQPQQEQAAPQPEPKAEAPAEQPAAEPQPQAAPAEQPQQEQPAPKRRKHAEEQPADQQEQAPQRKHKKQQPEPEAQAPAEQPQQQPAEQQQPEAAPAEQQPQAEQPAAPQAEQPAAPQPSEQPQPDSAPAQPAPQPQTQGENGAAAPAPDAAAQQPPAPPIVDKRTVEEQKAIAADPSKTDETVVLPVTNGAAVLDSDKDADNRGGQSAREERRRQREAQRSEQAAPPPKNDAEAQAAAPQVKVEEVRKQIEEKGQRIDAAPQFALPTAVQGGAAMQSGTADGQSAGGGRNAQGGNTTINNSTVNNTVNNVVIVQQNDNRTVLRVDNHMVVRGDDRPRLSRDAEETRYDRLPRGRYRETIERPNGVRLITIYNQYGDIIQRSRIGSDGEEYLLVYAPDADRDEPPVVYDAGRDLPPMRLRIPVEDYIIDTSSEPDRDYYDFLAEPPVERVERTYSIDEVKYSARLRDKVRRIDLDTITFATGSAEVPMSQARTLRKVADAIQKVLKRDPGETFLIEGHTDAVGSDQSNLILSDKRADSVASLLTEVYGIPPENMTTQGYGERYLKVRTQSAEQQNRRVTIRRVTTLVRPVAKH